MGILNDIKAKQKRGEIFMRTLKIHIKPSHVDYKEAMRQMEISKRLYNKANYMARQSYFRHCNKPYTLTGDPVLDDWICGDNYIGNPFNMQKLRKPLTSKININSKVATGIFHKVANDWQSFFKLKKVGLKANIPHYKKNPLNNVPYTKQAISHKALRDGFIKPAGFKEGVQLPSWFDPESVQACSLFQKNGKIWLAVIYHEAEIPQIDYESGTVAAIDFGVNDIVAMAYSDKSSPIVISGKQLKSYNREWNKAMALNKTKQKHLSSRFIDLITSKRNLRVEQITNRTANVVVQELVKHKVSKVILGKNDGWKQKVNIGKRNNQNFVQIPFTRLADNIAYKARSIGIEVQFQEESYTSKASFFSQDPIPIFEERAKHSFSGKRISRGLYKDGERLIHADINAAFNIMRKAGAGNVVKFWKDKINIQPLGVKLYT